MPVLPPDPSTIPGIQNSALDFIKQALRKLNALATGEEPTGAEGADALVVLNQMMDSWQAEDLMIYTTRIDDFALVAGQQVYTLGSGGDFNLARPARIDRMSIVILSNPTFPLEIGIPIYTTQNWQEQVPLKNVNSTFPLLVYDDGAFPMRNLSFWPIPQVINNVRIYSWQPLQYFANLSTKYLFPPGYAEAIAMSLATRLADEWAKPLSPSIAMGAQAALARIKVLNVPTDVLRCDDAVTNRPGGLGGKNYRAEIFGIP